MNGDNFLYQMTEIALGISALAGLIGIFQQRQETLDRRTHEILKNIVASGLLIVFFLFSL